MKKIVKNILSILIAISVFVCTIPVSALTSGFFDYEIVNGEAVITKYNGTLTEVTVPAVIDGYTVYGIGESAFKDNTKISKVTVEAGVKSVGASAFENCTSLATITLPSTIMFFGEKAIYNTAYYNNDSNWKKKRQNNSDDEPNIGGTENDSIQWEDIVASELEYLYLGKILVKISYSGTHSIRYGTTVIADGAFAGCDANQVSLANQTATIGNNAFKDCRNLTEIRIFNNISTIGKSAFENCTSLVNITLPEKDIQMYASAFYNTGYYNNAENWSNGVLYYGTTVIGVDENASKIEIADGTTEIIAEALRGKDVVIPASVTEISPEAFTDKEKATIYGYTDTYAYEYATAYNIKFVDLNTMPIKGDVNFDKNIDRDDYKILCDIATLQMQETEEILPVGDMDDDGAIDGIDVIILDLMLSDMPPSRIKGDADGDGDVDTDDYDLLVAISQTRGKVTDNIMFARCDLNEDGAVDSFDALTLDLSLKNIVPLI